MIYIHIENEKNNNLFEIIPIDKKDIFDYCELKKKCNPTDVPEKPYYRNGITSADLKNQINLKNPHSPHYKDGLKETGETYIDINENPVVFDENYNEKYFKKSLEYDNKFVFSGSKYYDWGLIFLTDYNKNTLYTAVYNKENDELFILPYGFEMSRPDENGYGFLFTDSGNKVYKYSLKLRPVISMYSYFPMLIEDEKIFSPYVPKLIDGVLFVPAIPVFNQLYCDVKISGGDVIISKLGSQMNFRVGDSSENEISSFLSEDGCLYVSVDTVSKFLHVTPLFNKELNKISFRAETDYYRRWDIEENTYAMLPVYSEDEYPDYIKEETKETINTVKKLDNTVNIGFITDIHYSPFETDRMIMKRTMNAYKNIASEIKTEGIIIGGDNVNEGTKEVRTNTYKELISHFDGVEAFFIKGNHDDGCLWDRAFLRPEIAVNHFTHKDIKDIHFSCLPKKARINEKDEDGTYWYFDNKEKKVRFIGIDSSDNIQRVNENGKLEYPGIGWAGISDDQYKWLLEDALNFNEDGWTVMLFLHMIPNPADTDFEEKNKISQPLAIILDAYKRKEKIERTFFKGKEMETTIIADFSKYKTAEIAAVVGGHYHKDVIHYSKENIPYVRVAAHCPEDFGKYTSGMIRKAETKEEILFDIISLDTNKKEIYFTRVGAGKDRKVTY